MQVTGYHGRFARKKEQVTSHAQNLGYVLAGSSKVFSKNFVRENLPFIMCLWRSGPFCHTSHHDLMEATI